MPETPPNPDYPIRVLVYYGRDWYARPSDDPPGERAVVWWARSVSVCDVADISGAWLQSCIESRECEYAPTDGKPYVFADWDDALTERIVTREELDRQFRALVERCFGSLVYELAPGLDPETGRVEDDADPS